MFYSLYPRNVRLRLFMEPQSGCKLPYLSKKEMREQNPDVNFGIIGEIGSFVRSSSKWDILITNSGQEVPILPRGSLKRPFEWIIGYIAVGENTYIAAVRSLFYIFKTKNTILKPKLRKATNEKR